MGKARMPWHGDITHTVLPDGRKVLRGSQEEYDYMQDQLSNCATCDGGGCRDCVD